MRDYFLKGLCALQADRRGVTAMEYAVIAGVIGTVLLGAFSAFFGDLKNALGTIAGLIPTS